MDVAIERRVTELEHKLASYAQLEHERDQYLRERDEYKKLYTELLERCRKLELGIIGQKREKFSTAEGQLTLSIIEALSNAGLPAATNTPGANPPDGGQSNKPPRKKPTGRKPLPENLPRVDILVLPPEVEQKGLEAFDKLGEEVTETVEYRPSSLVVVRAHRPQFVAKDKAATVTESTVLQAPPHELPIQRGLAGPGLLADTIVRRWQDHLPLHRLERIYARCGMDLARATVCTWHMELLGLIQPLLDAMWADAKTSPYLCTDATGVLVQALNECRRAHFFVVVAPDKHVLFGYTPKHDKAAVDALLAGYTGYLVADAHSVYDHLYKDGTIVEVACWAHLRRYFFKSLGSDPPRAKHALSMIQGIFGVERDNAGATPEVRLTARIAKSRALVDGFFAWCSSQVATVLDETPIAKAINYALNHRTAFERFLIDGRLPLHNNFSERELRREALGRKNWLFVGSDDGGETNAGFVSLLASCAMHRLEPFAYLRDLLCLLPSWPAKRVLELAPAYWQQTSQHADTQQLLAANVFRQASLGTLLPHSGLT
jgi:transposase